MSIIRGFWELRPDADFRLCDICRIYLEHQFSVFIDQSVWYKYLPLFAVSRKREPITGFFLRCAILLMTLLLSRTCDTLDCLDAKLASWFVFIVLRELIQCFLWQSFQRWSEGGQCKAAAMTSLASSFSGVKWSEALTCRA